jgi:hypothetical protein
MKNGWYKISYRIISEAKLEPEWISRLNTEDIGELEEGVRGRDWPVKVLGLSSVYEKIAGAYNSVRSRNNYSNDLYLLKR